MNDKILKIINDTINECIMINEHKGYRSNSRKIKRMIEVWNQNLRNLFNDEPSPITNLLQNAVTYKTGELVKTPDELIQFMVSIKIHLL